MKKLQQQLVAVELGLASVFVADSSSLAAEVAAAAAAALLSLSQSSESA